MSEMYELTVGPKQGDLTGSTNLVLQAAVDRVAELGGGRIHIRPGTYIMHDSLHLRSGVQICGSGEDSILKKPPSVSSRIIHFLGYGHYDLSVAEPEKFKPGTGIYITDDRSAGFYDLVATVNRRDGNELSLNRMLNHDINEEHNARAVTIYPLISGYHLEGASVSGLTLDGNGNENSYLHGCRGGGIFLLQAHNISLKEITVHSYNGDGISFQQCRNTHISDCTVAQNHGHGLHPGSGSVGTVMKNVTCRDNGMDGIFYCLRVSYSLCEGCLIAENGRDGISIGHRDTDALLQKNEIRNNERYGVYIRRDALKGSGHRTVFTGNELIENCRDPEKAERRAEIVFDSEVSEFHVLDNRIRPAGEGFSAISVTEKPQDLILHGNEEQTLKLEKDMFSEGISCGEPVESPAVGPEAAPRDADLHLTASARGMDI